nr:hypothetical protein [Ningiella sp. W23]
MNVLNALTITFISALSIGCTSSITTHNKNIAAAEPIAQLPSASQPFKIATWNVEHLAYPIDTGCRTRTPSEIAAMKAYAKT